MFHDLTAAIQEATGEEITVAEFCDLALECAAELREMGVGDPDWLTAIVRDIRDNVPIDMDDLDEVVGEVIASGVLDDEAEVA